MKNLILIRHAKSNRENPTSDINRSISQRGIKDAILISNLVENTLPQKYIIWSSIAKRTVETSYIFAQNLLYPIENINFKSELYTFDEKELFKQIAKCEDSCENIIIFGHNDAITNFVNKFGDKKINNVPTSGLVQIEFNTNSWKTISKGKTLQVLFPKEVREKNKNEYIH